MKISTEIGSSSRFIGEQKAVECVAKAGFDAWDFSMFKMVGFDWPNGKCFQTSHPLSQSGYLNFVRELRHIGEESGIVCNQSHAPFPSAYPLIRDYLCRAIECTAEAGGEICVIHPNNGYLPEQNLEMFVDLLQFADSYGVKIATENMWNWDEKKGHSSFAACATPDSFIRHIDITENENMVACLDIGHAEMLGSDTSAVQMVKSLGHRLQALHIHDNDKLNDSHQIPFSMKIDFSPIVKALKEIGYSGYFTLEADAYISTHTPDDVQKGLNELSYSAKKLAKMFDDIL